MDAFQQPVRLKGMGLNPFRIQLPLKKFQQPVRLKGMGLERKEPTNYFNVFQQPVRLKGMGHDEHSDRQAGDGFNSLFG